VVPEAGCRSCQILELCDKAEVTLSKEERQALQRDIHDNLLDETMPLNMHASVLTAKKEYIRELKHEARTQPGVSPSIHKHSRLTTNSGSSPITPHNASSHGPSAPNTTKPLSVQDGVTVLRSLAARQALLVSDQLSRDQQRLGISTLASNIVAMLHMHSIAPWSSLVLVLSRDFDAARISEGFVCVPSRFTLAQFSHFISCHAAAISKIAITNNLNPIQHPS